MGWNPLQLPADSVPWVIPGAMLTLAGLTMQGAQNELALRQTVRHLSELDAKDQQIYEAIGMMSMFAGLPAAGRAIAGSVHDRLPPDGDPRQGPGDDPGERLAREVARIGRSELEADFVVQPAGWDGRA